MTDTISDRGRLTLAETLSDSKVMLVRQLRKVLRRPMYVVYLFVQPVIFVLLFRYVFGGAINTGRVPYVDYLLPGIIVMTAVFGALTTGLGLTEDMKAGVVDRFRSPPDRGARRNFVGPDHLLTRATNASEPCSPMVGLGTSPVVQA